MGTNKNHIGDSIAEAIGKAIGTLPNPIMEGVKFPLDESSVAKVQSYINDDLFNRIQKVAIIYDQLGHEPDNLIINNDTRISLKLLPHDLSNIYATMVVFQSIFSGV